LLVSGCSWLGSGGDRHALEPAELVDFQPTVFLERIWSVDVNSTIHKYWPTLRPAASDDKIFVADHEGQVTALGLADGQRLWSVDLNTSLSGGVGYGANMVMLGTIDGQILVLNANSGSLMWTAQLSSEVLSSPQSDGEIVAVQTVDNKLYAFNASNGEQLWQYNGDMPILTVRGTSAPLIAKKMVLTAFDSGKLLAFNGQNGSIIWEMRLALPKGRTELERMIDIDGELLLMGDVIYSVSYQGRLAALSRGTGRTLWLQDSSSLHSPAHNNDNVFVTESGDIVRAFHAGSGQLAWVNEALSLRQLTAPNVLGNTLVVADVDGYIHLLDPQNGDFVGRIKGDRRGFSAPPLVVDDRLILQANDGSISAYRIR
jgi:outer membrane protein assembly factor BamB